MLCVTVGELVPYLNIQVRRKHRSRMTMQYYRIYVRLKAGGQATGRDLHNGPQPDNGTEIDVPLMSGRTVKARIGSPDTTPKGRAFRPVVTVYADEV